MNNQDYKEKSKDKGIAESKKEYLTGIGELNTPETVHKSALTQKNEKSNNKGIGESKEGYLTGIGELNTPETVHKSALTQKEGNDIVNYYEKYGIDRNEDTETIKRKMTLKQAEIIKCLGSTDPDEEKIIKGLKKEIEELDTVCIIFRNNKNREEYDKKLDAMLVEKRKNEESKDKGIGENKEGYLTGIGELNTPETGHKSALTQKNEESKDKGIAESKERYLTGIGELKNSEKKQQETGSKSALTQKVDTNKNIGLAAIGAVIKDTSLKKVEEMQKKIAKEINTPAKTKTPAKTNGDIEK